MTGLGRHDNLIPLPSASRYYEAASLLGRLLGNWYLPKARRGGDAGGDSMWTLWQYSHGRGQCCGQRRQRRQRRQRGLWLLCDLLLDYDLLLRGLLLGDGCRDVGYPLML